MWSPGSLTPATMPPATPARLHCVPSLPLQPPTRPAMSPRQGHFMPVAGIKLSKHSQAWGGLDARHREHPDLPPPTHSHPSPTFLRAVTCFHPASSNFTPTYSPLLGFPSCNLQLLSPPPPGLRDTKGFALPHRHRGHQTGQ